MSSILRHFLIGLVAALGLAASAPAHAQFLSFDRDPWLDESARSIFFFGGRFHSTAFLASYQVWDLPFEDNYFIGGGYQQFFLRPDWNVAFGAEVGAGARIGTAEPSSFEAWGGLVMRFDGIEVFDKFRITYALTAGVSIATAAIGAEATRATLQGDQTAILFYLGPEIAISPVDMPEWEGFLRVQHRSGGFGFIENLDGSNAATLGIRYRY